MAIWAVDKRFARLRWWNVVVAVLVVLVWLHCLFIPQHMDHMELMAPIHMPILQFRLVFALVSNCFCLFSSSCDAFFDLWLWHLSSFFGASKFEPCPRCNGIGLMTMTLLWCHCLTGDTLVHSAKWSFIVVYGLVFDQLRTLFTSSGNSPI